jgi:hypothetical protein
MHAEELNVLEVLASSDEVLPVLSRHITAAPAAIKPALAKQEAVPVLATGEDREKNEVFLMFHQESKDGAAPTANGINTENNQIEEEIAVPATGVENKEEKNEALAAVAAAAVHAAKIEDIGVAVGNENSKLQEQTQSPPSHPPVET